MSSTGNPKMENGRGEMDDDNETHKIYPERTNHKFEGWPILWILITIFLISAILWYTGMVYDLINWIKH